MEILVLIAFVGVLIGLRMVAVSLPIKMQLIAALCIGVAFMIWFWTLAGAPLAVIVSLAAIAYITSLVKKVRTDAEDGVA